LAYGKGKKRLSIAVSDELDERLNRLAAAYGVSKSAICAMYIAQTAAAAEAVLNSVPEMTAKLADGMAKEEGSAE
jgi:predicted transcriptional regulator